MNPPPITQQRESIVYHSQWVYSELVKLRAETRAEIDALVETVDEQAREINRLYDWVQDLQRG